MSRRRQRVPGVAPVLALALLVPLTALAHPAAAAPTASAEDGWAAEFDLVGGTTTHRVELLASTPRTGGATRLRLAVATGPAEHRFYGELPAGALTTQGGTTTLTTRLGALPLRVQWAAQPYSLAASFTRLTDDDRGTAGWTIAGTIGQPRVQLGTARCALGDAGGVAGPALAYDDSGYGDPLAKGLGLPTKGLRCAPQPTQGSLP